MADDPVTFDSGYLRVSAVHEIYYEQSGSQDGVPVVVLHGGPGSGTGAFLKKFFAGLDGVRLITFDQRGAGRSRPPGCIEDNTTQALVGDIERLREHLAIDRWFVFGGSWGSCLSLCYAEEHPERVRGLTIACILLMREADFNFLFSAAPLVFPEAYRAFTAGVWLDESATPAQVIKAYYDVLCAPPVETASIKEFAQSWCAYEAAVGKLIPSAEEVEQARARPDMVQMARIECHYFQHNGFLEPNQILKNVRRLDGIPCFIVHGRYDMVCPFKNAVDLHRALPHSVFTEVTTAGHHGGDGDLPARIREHLEAMLAPYLPSPPRSMMRGGEFAPPAAAFAAVAAAAFGVGDGAGAGRPLEEAFADEMELDSDSEEQRAPAPARPPQPQQRRAPPALVPLPPGVEDNRISIVVRAGPDDQVWFIVKPETELRKMMIAYCKKKGIDDDSVRVACFTFRGQRIQPLDTAGSLGLGQQDEILYEGLRN